MKRFLISLATATLLLAPGVALATSAVPWSITNLTDTFIFPNLVNGSAKGFLVSASSTVNGNFSVSTLTAGNCVQASTGGLLTTAAAPCGSGSGSAFSTTSANYWASLGLGFSTTSDNYNFNVALAATSSVASITALPNLSLPYSQLTGTPSTFPWPFTPGTYGAINDQATSTLYVNTVGIVAQGTSTIGNGAANGGLTISGNATTSGQSFLNGNVGIFKQPTVSLDVLGGATNQSVAIFSGSNANNSNIMLANTATGGRTFSLFSTANGNTLGGGKFIINDNTGGGARLIVDLNGLVSLPTNASTTQFSSFTKSYFGAQATTTIDNNGNIVIPSGSNLTITGKADGCPTFATGVLNSTGIACAIYPFPGTGNSTTSPIMLLASTTIGTGTQFGGLTVSGGATTTGNMAILSSLVIGTSTGALSNVNANNGNLFLYNTNTSGTSPAIVLGGNNGGDTDFWMGRTNNNDTINNDSLQIGAGLVPGTTPVMTWTYQGLEGIGTTSPYAKLSVHANPTDALINTTLFAIGSSTATATSTLFSISNTGVAAFSAGTATNPAISFIQDLASGIYQTAAGTLAFATNGVERMRIDVAGRIGVGTTTPQWLTQFSTSTAPQLALTSSSSNGNFHWTFNNIFGNLFFSTTSPTTFATSTTGPNTGYIEFPANGGCIGCTDITLPIGINLRNAKYVSATSSAYTANTYQDVYTVPSGRRALLLDTELWNGTNLSINWRSKFKSSGIYYNLNSTSTDSSQSSQGSNNGIILEAGESVSFITDTTTSLGNFHFQLIEFDASVPFKSVRLLNPAAGTTTLYTVPNGVTAIVMGNAPAVLTQPTIMVSNGSTVNVTNFKVFGVQNGATAVDGLNSLGTFTSIGPNSFNSRSLFSTSGIGGLTLNASDALVVATVGSLNGATGSMVWANIYEH